MTPRSPRSLRHEYSLYLEREIEAYKESVSREHLCGIADFAQNALEGELQLGMRDVLLAAEVDRIIAKRLKIPTFDAWRRRRMRNASEPKRPEYWGLRQHSVARGETRERHVVTRQPEAGFELFAIAVHREIAQEHAIAAHHD